MFNWKAFWGVMADYVKAIAIITIAMLILYALVLLYGLYTWITAPVVAVILIFGPAIHAGFTE